MKLAVLRPYEVKIWGENKFSPLYHVGVQSFSEDEAKEAGLVAFRQSAATDPALCGITPPKITRIEVLSDIHLDPARKQESLFEDIADACVGASLTDIQGATVNLLLTAVQRRYVKLAEAEARWDELMGRGKQALRRRYLKTTDARDVSSESEIAKRLVG